MGLTTALRLWVSFPSGSLILKAEPREVPQRHKQSLCVITCNNISAQESSVQSKQRFLWKTGQEKGQNRVCGPQKDVFISVCI